MDGNEDSSFCTPGRPLAGGSAVDEGCNVVASFAFSLSRVFLYFLHCCMFVHLSLLALQANCSHWAMMTCESLVTEIRDLWFNSFYWERLVSVLWQIVFLTGSWQCRDTIEKTNKTISEGEIGEPTRNYVLCFTNIFQEGMISWPGPPGRPATSETRAQCCSGPFGRPCLPMPWMLSR